MGKEISVYHLHYFVAKFLNLQRHVYNASDLLTLCCSFSCCQCFEYIAQGMSIDGHSEASSVAYQIIPWKKKADSARSFEELSDTETLNTDFDPTCNSICDTKGDRQCSEKNTNEGRNELEGEMVPLENLNGSMLTSLSSTPREDDYPIVHNVHRASI